MSDRRHRLLARLFDRVEVDFSCMLHGEPCLIWTGPTSGTKKEGDRNSRGHSYPRFSMDGVMVPAHHVMWSVCYGYIPYNRQIDHECSRRLCIQPAHLSKVSHRENQRRRDGKKPHARSEYAVPIPADLAADFAKLYSKFTCREVA